MSWIAGAGLFLFICVLIFFLLRRSHARLVKLLGAPRKAFPYPVPC